MSAVHSIPIVGASQAKTYSGHHGKYDGQVV